jgi:ABC-2 type transport system ATP-binding protein
VIYDDAVAVMRRNLLSSKVVELSLTGPINPVFGHGVTVMEHNDVAMKLGVDTSVTSVREVLGVLLEGPNVSDLTVVDPALETVISEIYELPRS